MASGHRLILRSRRCTARGPDHSRPRRSPAGGDKWHPIRTHDRPPTQTEPSRRLTGSCGRWVTTTRSRRPRSGTSGRFSSKRAGSRPVNACSTLPPAPATQPSVRHGPGRRSLRPTSHPKTSRRDAAKPARKGPNWSGWRPTPRCFPSTTTSSTSSPPHSGRCLLQTIRRWPTSS